MKIIRWNFLSITVVIVALVIVFNILFLDNILKNTIISLTQPIVGAKVEIDYLKTSLKNCSVSIRGLRVADRNDYFKNLIDIEKINFDVRFWPILRKKFIIDEMSVDGIKWQTQRKTSGKLPPKQEKKFAKEKKDSKFSKMFDSAKTKTISEVNKLPSVEMFNNIQEQINNFDINKIVKDTDLSSVKEAEKIYNDLQNKYKQYQDKINNFNHEEKINKAKKIIDEISKSKISGLKDIANTAKKVSQLKEIKEDLDKILKELDTIKKDISSTINVSKQLKNSITNDVDTICEKISIPNLNTKNISQMLFGNKWVSRVEKAMYYYSIIKQYLPKKSAEEKAKEVKQRDKGRDVLFKEKTYPTLLISKINISGTTAKTKEEQGLVFSGLIKYISSSPDMVSEPITLNISGNNNSQKLNIAGTFDHRTNNSKDVLKVSFYGLSGQVLNLEPNAYLPLIDTANLDFVGNFDIDSVGFKSVVDLSVNNIKEKNLKSIDGNLKYLAQITNTIKSFKVNLSAQTQNSENLDVKITSDIDKKLYDAINKLFSSKVNEAKGKIKQKVNELAQAKIKEIEKSLEGNKNEVLKQIKEKIGATNDFNKQIEKAINKR
jgi:uncharacterized protein (TIGR03545 family)